MTLQEKVAEVERLLNEMKEEALKIGEGFTVDFDGGGFEYLVNGVYDRKTNTISKTTFQGYSEPIGNWYTSNC